MSARVFMPAVPRWFVALAAVGWLGLTAVGVLLRRVEGFVPELAGSLASTAAGILLGVTGVGALLEVWRKRQMRQRTGPFVLEAMTEAIEAYGRLIACYTQAGSSVLPGAPAVAAQQASTLLTPPLTEERDLQLFYAWAQHARLNYLRTAGDMLDAEPHGPTAEDACLVRTMRQELGSWESAATDFDDAIVRLVDYDPPGLAPLFAEALEVRSLVRRQTAAVTGAADEQSSASDSWYACSFIMSSATTIAIATDAMFGSVRKVSGRRANPLQRALQSAEAMQQMSKVTILASVSAVRTHESFVEAMDAADTYFDRPEALARRERIEKARARRRRSAEQTAALTVEEGTSGG